MIFVSNPAKVEYGSIIQRKVCENLQITGGMVEDFWETAGSRAVEEAIRRKRNTLTNALKSIFQKYCQRPWKEQDGTVLPPPDPMKIIPKDMWDGESRTTGNKTYEFCS